MSSNSKNLHLMIVAGEPSGDAHAGALVRALRDEAPDVHFEFFGATGPSLRSASVETIVDSDNLAIMGIVEVGRVLSRFVRAFKQLKRAALERKPDAVILVDWPEFNLRLAKTLHRRGLRVIYYISPQVWAWRSYRVARIRRDIDLLLSILPFEPEWFARRGMQQVQYVGHPLTGQVRSRQSRAEFCHANDLDPARPLVALLPGSRHKELVRILPPMLEAAALLAKEKPDVQFVLVVAPSRSLAEAKQIIADRSDGPTLPQALRIVHHETREALAAADAAAIASGTATLEAAILGTPMVIVYKESSINWHVLGSMITAEHYGLVNLIAKERIVTELMQKDLNGERLSAELVQLLDEKKNRSMRAQLLEVASQLGEGQASQRAAEKVLAAIQEWGHDSSSENSGLV